MENILETPDWHDLAQCIGTDQTVFFPESSGFGKGHAYKNPKIVLENIAKSICRVCVVSDECLEYALETNQSDGIWGGKTPEERKRIRKQAQARARQAS